MSSDGNGGLQRPPSPAFGAGSTRRRWVMLGVLALGFSAFTFNWFVMPSAFAGIGEEFTVGVPDLALMISVFVLGYAIMHVPAGFIAVRFGLCRTMVAGLALEGILTAAAGLAPGPTSMLVLRLAAGVAASVFAGIAISAASVWFREREHALAMGVVSAAFSVGVAVGLYVWAPVMASVGWRAGLGLAGAAAVAVAVLLGLVYRVPSGADTLSGIRLTREAARVVFRNRTLWRYSFAFLVGYGGYFVVAQLIGTYAGDQGYSASSASIAALLAGVGGLPGSLIAGWLADRTGTRLGWFVGFVALQAVGTFLIPFAGESWIWLAAFLVGFAFNGSFALWQTVPADEADLPPEHVATAAGLMLTIGGVGGFLVPWVFGLVVSALGYGWAWTIVGVGTAATLLALLAPGQVALAPADRAGARIAKEPIG